MTFLAAATPILAYDRATEDTENVKNKLFPKDRSFQLEGRLGYILNQSYLNTLLLNGQATYFFSEEWGVSVEGSMAMNKDKDERRCIETFYNDPHDQIASECGDRGAIDAGRAAEASAGQPQQANWGPAYVSIRELKYILDVNAVWNPIYGKQIILLSATNYFDFYTAMGIGIAMSDFYPKTDTLRSGNESRGDSFTDAGPNPGTLDPADIGDDGRPDSESQTSPLIHLSVGQRFHFLKRFMINAELKNYTLLGTESGFDNFLTLMGGVGMRF